MTTEAEWTRLENATQEDIANSKGFYHFTGAAWENADQTVYLNKAAPVEDIYDIAMGGLVEALSYTDDKEAIKFFAGLGVRA